MVLASIIQTLGGDIIVGIGASIATMIGGYVIVRERLLKNEIKIDNVYSYIDSRSELLESKIKDLASDIAEFKDLNKETTKSLSENTTAIRELKFVLNVLKDQLKTGGDFRFDNKE
jgi:hypothetical protein